MTRQIAWGGLVLLLVVGGVATYEAVHGSAARKGEVTMTGKK